VVTGATSVTSTAFVGNLTGTVATATQNSITTATGLVSVGALNSGTIATGFGEINTGASGISTTGNLSGGNIQVADDITHAGDANTYLSFDTDSLTSYNGGVNNLSMTTGGVVFNEGGGGVDFRVEASGHTHALFVEGSTGHVGIGTQTNPNHPLHIGGDENYLISVLQSGTNVNLANFAGNGASLDIVCDGANNFVRFNSATSGDDMKFATNDGNVRMTLLAAGGMTFNGDTAAANALDDYEEGTWTPVIGGSSGTSGQTYGIQAGTYTKVGNMCTASAYITLAAKGTVGNNLQLQGLPFTTRNVTNNIGAVALARVEAWNLADDHTLCLHIGENGTAGTFTSYAGATSGHQSLTTDQITNSSSIILSFTYHTT